MEREINSVKNIKILYVEDDADTAEPIVRFLKRRFSKVVLATDGKLGYEKFCEIKPDIILTDLLMGNHGGIGMIEKIRIDGFNGPILISSAVEDMDMVIKSVDMGISKYIMKPIRLKELGESLNEFADEILRKRNFVILLSESEKKEKERIIGHLVSSSIKRATGKGPIAVKVFISNDGIELPCSGVFTIMEKTLLNSRNNYSIIEHTRVILYEELRIELETVLNKEVGYTTSYEGCSIDAHRDIHTLSFVINN